MVSIGENIISTDVDNCLTFAPLKEKVFASTKFLIKIILPYPFDMIVANYTYFTDMFCYTRLSVFPGTVVGVKFLTCFSVVQICGVILTFVTFTFEL